MSKSDLWSVVFGIEYFGGGKKRKAGVSKEEENEKKVWGTKHAKFSKPGKLADYKAVPGGDLSKLQVYSLLLRRYCC